ncbi:hypothetical protein TNIN_227071 [Trichonephila inaurata madagascariensis]|uniref:Uncharacterized protein n=1 Tax=Trichonephila inaurata madagascariensis TaxID=2747483 RepID=A0A8X6WLJ6_9ARAC|nr:hypothetical protein TNIN_227071 [Trichonephila inaurata madagascariensis]
MKYLIILLLICTLLAVVYARSLSCRITCTSPCRITSSYNKQCPICFLRVALTLTALHSAVKKWAPTDAWNAFACNIDR